MPNEVEDAIEYIKGVPVYNLRIYGTLINGQKVVVNITGIKPFFDVVVPDNEPGFETKLKKISYWGRKRLRIQNLE